MTNLYFFYFKQPQQESIMTISKLLSISPEILDLRRIKGFLRALSVTATREEVLRSENDLSMRHF